MHSYKNVTQHTKYAESYLQFISAPAFSNNNNTQEAALAIMSLTRHPQKSAEPSLHERTHNKSLSAHNLPVTLPE